jgi:hypothetical protein
VADSSRVATALRCHLGFPTKLVAYQFADGVVFGELCPGLDGALGCLVAGVCEVESSAGVVVRHRALWFAGS